MGINAADPYARVQYAKTGDEFVKESQFFKDAILREIINLKEDGSFQMNMEFFDYCTGLKMTNERFDKLFGGPPRKPETKMTQREMDIARSAQDVTEEIMLRMAQYLHKETGAKYLCLAGGVASGDCTLDSGGPARRSASRRPRRASG